MSKDLAFRATYADWKLIKTRGVIQVVMEVPLADAHAAYQVLGGMPDAGSERWFAIAPLAKSVPPPFSSHNSDESDLQVTADWGGADTDTKAKRNWRDMSPSQQAGIRCDDPTFIAFLRETKPDDWHAFQDAAECVRFICGVNSRSELSRKENHGSRVIWHQLDSEYQGWLALERV